VRREWDESDPVTEPPWEVSGKTVAEVRESLEDLGAEWGKGGGTFYAKFVDEEDGSVTAVVYAQFVKILPTWKDEEDAEADAKARWKTMMKALERHEQRHVDIALEAVKEFADSLPGTLCSGIVNRHAQAEKKMQTAQKRFDSPECSDHGTKPKCPYGGVDY
jgi:predicted secreted Zn-dependent protease